MGQVGVGAAAQSQTYILCFLSHFVGFATIGRVGLKSQLKARPTLCASDDIL